MVKIGYKGHMQTFRIKVGAGLINRWGKDEIKDFSEGDAKHLLKNKNFYKVSGGKPEEKKIKVVIEEKPKEEIIEEVKEEKVEFDLDGDGDFDADDLTIAAKTMAAGRKKKD